MDTNAIDVIALLNEGKVVQIYPQGYSMYPLLLPGRDQAIINGAERDHLRRGDVVLYRRDNGILVLHRIWRIKSNGIYLVGDNQVEIEGPIGVEQIKGKLIAIVRKGRSISIKNPIYRLYGGLWLNLRPVRKTISKAMSNVFRRLHIRL